MKVKELTAYEVLCKFWKTNIKHEGRLDRFNHKTFLSENLLIKFCQKELGIKISKLEVNKLLQDKLIGAYKFRKDRRYPCHTILRIEFLEELKTKFDFSLATLQHIVTYEDIRIQQLLSQQIQKKTFDPIEWVAKEIKALCDDAKEDFGPEWEKKEVAGYRSYIQQLKKISKKKLSQLTEDEKKILQEYLWQVRVNEESQIYDFIKEYHYLILKGYSPQVALTGAKIEWKKTFDNIKQYNFIDYFSTPDFKVDSVNKRIVIDIINPHAVKSLEMREIGKIYTLFAEKFGSKKKQWGENSGRKLLIQERNKQLRELYRKLKKDKSNISSELLIDKYLVPFCANLGFPASVERIQKIIYSKE